MRRRNDLYYAQRISDGFAIHPDGSVGELETFKTEGVKTIKGRREDKPRVVKRVVKNLGEAAVYPSLGELYASQEAKVKPYKRYLFADNSWTIDDMPDPVIESYSAWENELSSITQDEIREIATEEYGGRVMAGEDVNDASEQCPYCKDGDLRYMCRACGYSRSYYKYPIVRFRGLNDKDEQAYHDVPFDVGKILMNQEGLLGFRIDQVFSETGKMSAVQYAVLNTQSVFVDVAGVDGEPMESAYIDAGDVLAKNIEIPIARWAEDGDMINVPDIYDYHDTKDLIRKFQKHISVELVRETTDNEYFQDKYDKLIDGVRMFGKDVLDIIIRQHYEGMGEVGYYLYLDKLPFESGFGRAIEHASDVRSLIDKASGRIDAANGRIDLRNERGW